MADLRPPTPDINDVVREVRCIAEQMKSLSTLGPTIAQLDARQEKLVVDLEQLKSTVTLLSQSAPHEKEKPPPAKDCATPAEDALIKNMVDRSRALYPLLQWFIKIAVLAMVDGIPALNGWMRSETMAQLSKVRRDISGVSGLAVILFAVDPSDDKIMYRKSAGPVWTFVVRCVFATMIRSARAQIFADKDDEPLWISELGNPVYTFAILSARLKEFNNLRELPEGFRTKATEPQAKKRRVSDREDARALSPSRVQFMQSRLIRRLKRSVCRHLTYCRHEVKVYLYDKIMFLVDMIRVQGGPAKANEQGFRFVFKDPSPGEAHPSASAGSDQEMSDLWNVGENAVPSTADDLKEADATNERMLRDLDSRFPYLTVQLHWRRRVVRCEHDKNRDDSEYHNSELTWPASERVSLVRVAGGIFLELVRVRSLITVMRCSEYSAMAILTLALGLRGLLRDTLGLPMTAPEALAKGSVHAVLREKNDNFVSVLLPNSERVSGCSDVEESLSGRRDELNTVSDENSSTQAEEIRVPARDSQRLARAKEFRCTVKWNTYVSERPKGMSVFGLDMTEDVPETVQTSDCAESQDDPEINLLAPLLNEPFNAFLHIPGEE